MFPCPITDHTAGLLRDLRRALHRMPEPGKEEHATQKFIIERLKTTGADAVLPINTGVKAVFYAPAPRGTLCFRADMDALRICELNDVPYASGVPGMMHACGHDGHMAILLAFAMLLGEHRDKLPYNVVLLFQPGEEGLAGARDMIAGGALADPRVDAVFGLHLMPQIEQGRVGIKAGRLMAAAAEIDIAIYGRNAHGAMPHLGTDAVHAAAQFIVQLQSIVSRSTDPFEQCVISIGKITGGEARNIVAAEVYLQGTMRTYTQEVYDNTVARINALLSGLEQGMGVRTGFERKLHYPAVINDAKLAEKVAALVGDAAVTPEPMMVSEDFAFYQHEVPGLFLFLGCGNAGKGFVSPLHTPRFDFDEAALLPGLETFWRIALCGGMV